MDLNNYKRDHGSTSNEPVAQEPPAQPKAKAPSPGKVQPADQPFAKDSKPQARPATRAYDEELDTEVSKHPSTGGNVDSGQHDSMKASKMTAQPSEIKNRKDDLASDKC